MVTAKPLVILGSARSAGDTANAVRLAFRDDQIELIDLLRCNIGRYSYVHANRDDDFPQIARRVLPASAIVFATPVYWYSMSGGMKDFFDRLTDLLEIDKDVGRELKGKDVWLLAAGSEAVLPEGFEVPFLRTARYFSMIYRGAVYLYTGTDGEQRLRSEANVVAFGAMVTG